MIVIVFGLPGSGKTHFASWFANLINAEYINSDRLRKQRTAPAKYPEKEKYLRLVEGYLKLV
jgi:predicted kinase